VYLVPPRRALVPPQAQELDCVVANHSSYPGGGGASVPASACAHAIGTLSKPRTAPDARRHTMSRPVDGFLVETQKIAPGSVAVTAHSPNRMEDSKASSGGTPRPCKATTMAPSRTPQPPTEIGSMEMSRTVG